MKNDNSSIENKLATLKYYTDDTPHLILDKEKCKNCQTKRCICVCPAKVYEVDGDEIKVEYENCLECGACRIACPNNAIDWKYPKSSCGVLYKFS